MAPSLDLSLKKVSASRELRFDAHHYVLASVVEPLHNGIGTSVRVCKPFFVRVQNGENLPAASYIRDGADTDWLYASVSAVSHFHFDTERAIPIKGPDVFAYAKDISEISLSENNVVITRSGTPGISWARELLPQDVGEAIIPSGFLITLDVPTDIFTPTYVCSILNHPVWRVWTASLAAGKRQRNLSQDHLAQTRIPVIPRRAQNEISRIYQSAVRNIEEFERDYGVLSLCDNILNKSTGLNFEPLSEKRFFAETIKIKECAASPLVRLDARYHNPALSPIYNVLDAAKSVRIEELVVGGVIKSPQPPILAVDQGEEPRVVATVSLQAGQVVEEYTKQTSEDFIATADSRKLAKGDLLLAVDGEGSIGKAAVFDDDYDAVCDTHIAILRTLDEDISFALCCFINSSLGKAQVEKFTSGATGQIQISTDDVRKIKIPVSILDKSTSISADYKKAIRQFQTYPMKCRKEICAASSQISLKLLDNADLEDGARAFMANYQTQENLFDLLSLLKPHMF